MTMNANLVMLLQKMLKQQPFQNKGSTYQTIPHGYGAPNPVYERDENGEYWVTQDGFRKKIDPRELHANRWIY